MEDAIKIGLQRNIENLQNHDNSMDSADVLSFQSPSEMPEYICASRLNESDVAQMIKDQSRYFERFYT